METLKYQIIKTLRQYSKYCNTLEALLEKEGAAKEVDDEIELLTFLIEKWDKEHNSFADVDPITMLKHLMEEHHLRSKDLVTILGVSKGLVSDILHYKKGLSREVIRTLATYFKISQDAFNREYKLKVIENLHLKNASVMNTRKKLELAH